MVYVAGPAIGILVDVVILCVILVVGIYILNRKNRD